MSEAYQVRRNDKVMATGRAADLLARGFAGRLATVGADGWAYVIRLPYVCIDNEIWVHNTAARGHLRANGTRRAGVLRRRGRRGRRPCRASG